MIEEQVRKAIIAELERQAEVQPDSLRVEENEDGLIAHGSIGLDELVMAVVGAVTGGP
ncbi:hypothetical protein [Pelagibacterium luteolum]|uniref:Acyl carrier protein n=1 Tax=Pelagibacterium luteolum TaxID=440168 RepID=A0A1G8A882_9HYPH|nr:hypothetical protein [Pelagibacterium luteolum]SDH17061.1 hypothetical protein SAMN04487974_12710 [Pelagibacterium luteolum]